VKTNRPVTLADIYAADRLLRGAGGTAKLQVLVALAAAAPLTAAELSERLGIKRNVLDNLLCRMASAGFVTATPRAGRTHRLAEYRPAAEHPSVRLALEALKLAQE